MARAGSGEIIGRAGPVGAEMEIEADRDAGDREPVEQDALDEFLGAQRRQRRVEAQHDRAVEPGRRQQPQLVALVGEAEQRLLRPEEAARMRLEGQRGRRPGERAARSRAVAITAWWPRCTPSKLPIATTAPRSGWPGGVSPWATANASGRFGFSDHGFLRSGTATERPRPAAGAGRRRSKSA